MDESMPTDMGHYHNMLPDPLDAFVGREQIIALFNQHLQLAKPKRFRLLAIRGNSGTGKTFLMQYLIERVCPTHHWQTGQLNFAQAKSDFRFILTGLEDAFATCVSQKQLKYFRTRRDEYIRLFDEYRTFISVAQHVEAKEYASLSNISETVQINTDLHKRERHLRAEWSRALIELAEKSRCPLCLFIDDYVPPTEADDELDSWLWEEVLLKLEQATSYPLLVVTCGWKIPNNARIKPFAHIIDLDDFNQEQIRGYLEKQAVITPGTPLSDQEELTSAFFELTKGHPLVLSLATAYFKELEPYERTIAHLKTDRPLLDERARVEFLEERLLSRLKEPYKTFLAWGSILRTFDQATLQTLLEIDAGNASSRTGLLDNDSYGQFLRYPFVRPMKIFYGDAGPQQFTFHYVVRRVSLSALRRLYPDTKEQLHRKMAVFYSKTAKAEQEFTGRHASKVSRDEYADWFAKLPEKAFRAYLEYLYHGLQVREFQSDRFEDWENAVHQMMDHWQNHHVGLLLDLIKQLIEEEEAFFHKSSYFYGQYLVYLARFLERGARWKDAIDVLEQAMEIFDQLGDAFKCAGCLNSIGLLYQEHQGPDKALKHYQNALALYEKVNDSTRVATTLDHIGFAYEKQGDLKQALFYFKRSLSIKENMVDIEGIARSLNNIGGIYERRGDLKQSLQYFEQSLILREQIGDPVTVAVNLNNLGNIHHQLGKLEQALSYYQRSLNLREKIGNPSDIAITLNNMGGIYNEYGQLEQARKSFEHALHLWEQLDQPEHIAITLNNLGGICNRERDLQQALNYFERAYSLWIQMGILTYLPASLNNIADIYRQQNELDKALNSYEQALKLSEQMSNPTYIAASLHNIGNIYEQKGELDLALSYYERGLTIDEQVGNPIDIATSCHSIVNIFLRRKNWKMAIEQCTKALRIYEQLGSGFELQRATYLEGLSYCFRMLNDVKQANLYEEQARQIRNKFN
jgi:tetratricopeptide (TPR) repeat protein